MDFNCPEVATSGKSGWEVFRGWLAFKLFTYGYLVDNSFKVGALFGRGGVEVCGGWGIHILVACIYMWRYNAIRLM